MKFTFKDFIILKFKSFFLQSIDIRYYDKNGKLNYKTNFLILNIKTFNLGAKYSCTT